MKTIFKNLLRGVIFSGALCFIQTILAAPNGPQTTNSIPTNTTSEIPKSVFDDKAGTDPFFPTRSKTTTSESPVNPPNVTDFIIQGMTKGSKPTVVINTKTFEIGQTDEVKTPTGTRVSIRLVEIKEDSVMIKIGDSPSPVEVKFPPGKF